MPSCYSREAVLQKAAVIMQDVATTSAHRTLLKSDSRLTVTEQMGQVAFWKRESGLVERSILHLMRSHIVATESRHPGSGDLCARVGAACVKMWDQREKAGEDPGKISHEFDLAINEIAKTPSRKRRLCEEDLIDMLSSLPMSIREEARDAVLRMSLGSSVSVKRSRSLESSVREVQGCSLKVGLDPRITKYPTLISPKIVLFDGAIDSVGQIHRALEDSSHSGQGYLIICRSASHEVVQTVSLNSSRGTISVILVFSRLDDLTVGSLEDMCEYTGAWTISAQSGESISTGFDRLHTVRGRVWLEGDALRCDSVPSGRTEAHISRLRQDAATRDQSVADFLGTRISGLSSSKVEVMIGESDSRSDVGLVERLDSSMRSLTASFTRGVSDTFLIPASVPAAIRSSVLTCAPAGPKSAGSVASGVIQGLQFAKTLCTIGHAVVS